MDGNHSILGIELPSEIKDATITPLLKHDAQNWADNYQGSAVVNHAGKVLERFVYADLMSKPSEYNVYLLRSLIS